MNIIVIYPNAFPISGAATNRIISICRVLIDQGNHVKLFITRPTENNKYQHNFKRKGKYLGIEFQYATKSIFWPDNRILRLWLLFTGKILTLKSVFYENRRQKVDIVISAATYNFYENIDLLLLGKLLKYKLIYTLDEYPWVIINKEEYNRIYRYFYLRYFFRMFDGFIVMTMTLMDYYKRLSDSKAKFVHIPMSVDMDRFSNVKKLNGIEYIAYCGGDKTGKKDGIDILIKAFSLIKDRYPEINLHIAGEVHSSIKTLIADLSLGLRVKLMGYIKRDDVPAFLANAKVLCLARPNNKQAEGGFPTKLGEYLASGKPVIVTDVGEISSYLRDGVNAFISLPDNIDDFARKLTLVLDNYPKAIIVGDQGRKLVEDVFEINNYKEVLNIFLQDLIKNETQY